MEKFNPYRMISRIECATRMLMLRYRLTTRQANADLMNTIVALSMQEMVSDSDRLLLQQMAAALDYNITQADSSGMTTEQIREQDAIGRSEIDFIFNRYTNNYHDKILALTDFAAEAAEYKRTKARRRRRVLTIILAIILAIGAGIGIYHLPFFAERRLFAEIENEYNNDQWAVPNSVCHFCYKYPQSDRIEEVIMMGVRSSHSCNNHSDLLEMLQTYNEYVPNGQYADECRQYYDELWNGTIADCKAKVGNSPTDGQAFVINMLQYMHVNNLTEIYAVLHPAIKVKEFNQYPHEVQNRVAQLHSGYFVGIFSSFIRPVKEDINLSGVTNSVKECVKEIGSTIEKPFDTHYLNPATKIVIVESDALPADCKNPIIHVYYTIVNDEVVPGFPSIWIVSQKNAMQTQYQSESALLGIGVQFTAQFSIPGTDHSFIFSEYASPGDDDINEAGHYTLLREKCTNRIIADLTESLSFPE